MRTTVTISDNTLKELLHYSHAEKPAEAINIAIQEWIRVAKIAEIKKLRGRLPIDDNLRSLRNKELKKTRKLHGKDTH